jgi:hypothetical protein
LARARASASGGFMEAAYMTNAQLNQLADAIVKKLGPATMATPSACQCNCLNQLREENANLRRAIASIKTSLAMADGCGDGGGSVTSAPSAAPLSVSTKSKPAQTKPAQAKPAQAVAPGAAVTTTTTTATAKNARLNDPDIKQAIIGMIRIIAEKNPTIKRITLSQTIRMAVSQRYGASTPIPSLPTLHKWFMQARQEIDDASGAAAVAVAVAAAHTDVGGGTAEFDLSSLSADVAAASKNGNGGGSSSSSDNDVAEDGASPRASE